MELEVSLPLGSDHSIGPVFKRTTTLINESLLREDVFHFSFLEPILVL